MRVIGPDWDSQIRVAFGDVTEAQARSILSLIQGMERQDEGSGLAWLERCVGRMQQAQKETMRPEP